MQVQDAMIEIPGLKLGVKWWGPRESAAGQVPALALHGWLDNAATFDGIAPHLCTAPFGALDLPGHGKSDHFPPFASYLFIEYVAAVHAVLDALSWTRVRLVGHSLGAGVAAIVAGTVPDRVERLVLLEGLGPMTETAQGAPARLARALTAQQRHQQRDPTAPVYPDVESVVNRLRAVQSSMAPASARTLLTRGLVEVEDGVTWRSDRRLRHPSRLRLTEAQVVAFLEAITAPSLLIRADNGLPFASDLADARVGAFEDLKIVEVAGGHHVHLDDPDVVAPLVAQFWDRSG